MSPENGLVRQESAITKTPVDFLVTLSPDDRRFILNSVAQGHSDEELGVLLYTANRLGLDPFAKQIYSIKRKGKAAIQIAIDGFRVIAHRSGLLAGIDPPVFVMADDPQFIHPERCSVTVYRLVQGVRCAFTAEAWWDEYYPGESQGFTWRQMPRVMLRKVAEAQALRMAFPQDLSGVYAHEEMDQAGGNGFVAAETVGYTPSPPAPMPPYEPGDGDQPNTREDEEVPGEIVTTVTDNGWFKALKLTREQIARVKTARGDTPLEEVIATARETFPTGEGERVVCAIEHWYAQKQQSEGEALFDAADEMEAVARRLSPGVRAMGEL